MKSVATPAGRPLRPPRKPATSLAARLVIVLGLAVSACAGTGPANSSPAADAGGNALVPVVAAENFYGDLASQLGAGHVAVTSILSEPDLDPHAYEATVQNGVSVSQARLVIENGAGYDTWMDKLLAASPSSERIVLMASDLAGDKIADNPHFWYGIDNIGLIAQSITAALQRLDPAHRSDYAMALSAFQSSLIPLQQKIAAIKAKYGGTPVGLTETIFLYQTEPAGLRVLTPFEFEKAVAEGNDPPAEAVIRVDNQISQRQIKVLIYNAQTLTPLTSNLQSEARQNAIPLVAVSETMPAGQSYQAWMLAQLNDLEQALGG